jgi:glycosyltransferase involved in cell wall biosynthesis
MASKLRLLVVSHAYPRKSATSHGVFIHRWNLGLRDHGVDVAVLQLAQWSPPWPLSEVDRAWREGRRQRIDMMDALDGIVVHHPRVLNPRPSRFFPGDPWDREARTLISYCQRVDLGRIDAVVGHFMVPDGYHSLRLGAALGVPTAAVAWGDDVHAWPAQWSYWRTRLREVLRGIDVPVACSHRLVQDANEWLERGRDVWRVVYGGVDHERFRPTVDQQESRRRSRLPRELHAADLRIMLMLGQPVRAKGYVELLDAWRALAPRAPNWRLVMGGPGWSNLDIPAEISARALDRYAFWLGPQPAETIATLLQASDAFVLPSHNEGLSLSVLEAMATGLPTITTDVGGHSEVITKEEEGWLVPPHDVESLVAALSELTESAEERTRRGAMGRRAALRIGSPAENASRLAAHLEDAIGAGRLARRAVGSL